ncbi:MAG: histidine phosphatase family protein [Elusimicrobiota bacterium]
MFSLLLLAGTLPAALQAAVVSAGQSAASARPAIIIPAIPEAGLNASLINTLPLPGVLDPGGALLLPAPISAPLRGSHVEAQVSAASTELGNGPETGPIPASSVILKSESEPISDAAALASEQTSAQSAAFKTLFAQKCSRRIGERVAALKKIFTDKRDESPTRDGAAAADVRGPIIGKVRQGLDAQVAAMRRAAPKEDAVLLDQISAEGRGLLSEVGQLLAAGEIDPRASLRVSAADAPKPISDRELRIGFYPVAADPFHWGHFFIALRAIATLRLDKVVFVLQGDDSRKPTMTQAFIRHPMGRAVLKFFMPFFEYSDIALGTGYDGETNLFRLLALNGEQQMRIFYLVGADHYRLLDKNGNPDTLAKIEGNTQNPDMDYHPAHHKITVVFTEREGSEADVPTWLDVVFMPKVPFTASSTLIREGHHALMPYAAYEYVQRHAPGLYGVPVVLKRALVHGRLRKFYESLPGGFLRLKGEDPVVSRLRASKAELWAVRHGENEANLEGLLNGQGTDKPLTRTPNEKGVSGRLQAESAAREQYRELGGDAWARRVLSGELSPVVLLQSPLLRARETADAFKRLLSAKRAELSNGESAPGLYEEDILPDLAEIAYGGWDGRPITAGVQKLELWSRFDCYKGLGKGFFDRFPGVNAAGTPGESRFDVMLRQRRVFDLITRRYGGRKVVLFTHFETVVAQQAVLGLLPRDPADGALKAQPVPYATPLRLVP